MSKKKNFKKSDESLISGVYAGPEQMNDPSQDALIAAVYAGPEEMGHMVSSQEADILEVYAGPEEMNLVYAGPEEVNQIRVKETFTDKVYAGPGLMRDGDQDEIFQTVYGGPPAQKQGFFSKLKDKLMPHRKSDRPYPENYADEPEVIIPEETVPDPSEKTMACPVCGKINEAAAKYCSECGSPLKKAPPKANV